MECYAQSIIHEELVYLQVHSASITVAPDFDCLVAWACSNQILLDAGVHAVDPTWMELEDKVVIKDIIRFVL